MADELKRIAEFICSFRLDDVDEDTVRAAKFCVLDTLGSALGAADAEEIQAIGNEYRKWNGIGENEYTAAAWAQEYRTGVMNAIMINGLMAHELELDDVHTRSKSHIGAVVVPTAWTLADAIGASGREFLEAVIVGYEVMGRVGMGMDVSSNRKRGWHTTGVIGTFGAAAAAAKLLKLVEKKVLSALGMAGTQSCGLWAFLAEGASCKKLHPARAAVNGLSACLLASAGMTGPEHILDAVDGGLYAAVSDSFDMKKLTDGLGDYYIVNAMDKKPYPCCRTTHHAIDAAITLRAELDPEEINSVLVETYDVGVLQCGFKNYPGSAVEAKFSIPYTCAAAFVRGKVTAGEFTEECLSNPEIERIARRTSVVPDELFSARYPKRWGSRMTVTMNDGKKYVRQIDDMSGSTSCPLTPKQEKDKFVGLAQIILGSRVREVMETVLAIDGEERLPDLSMRD